MKKRSLLMAASLVLALLVATTGTLAYLSDVDSDVNVMTLGNVQIEQIEMQRANPKKHTGLAEDGDLVPFVDGQPLYPAYPVNGQVSDYTAEANDLFYWGPYVTAESENSTNGAGNGLWNPQKLVGAMDKIVFVKNTGSSPAYYRTWIAFECPEGMEYSEGPDKEFMMNINLNARFVWKDIGYTEIDGTRYLVMCATYKNELAPGEISRPSLLQVVMTHNATNEDMTLLGDTYEILVFTEAVQTANMPEDPAAALNVAFGDPDKGYYPWEDVVIAEAPGITEGGVYDLKNDVYTIDSAYFHTQKVNEPVIINGNGATVESNVTSVDAFQWEGGTIPAMSAIFSSANGSKVTVSDLTFTGTISSVMAGHYQNATYNNYNTEFNNVNIVDTEVVSFSANVSPALTIYGTATLNNCNVYGTELSPLDTDPMWPVYDVAVTNYATANINNSKIGSIQLWNQAKVIIDGDSEVDVIVLRGNMNAKNSEITVKSGSTVGAIDLSAITDVNKVFNITIEDGATFGGFVDGEETYTTLEDWKSAQ